ncbi:N-acetylmuramoyl-L-alanine amidase [Bacillus wiedmannii]|nr:N-acetylmuramoyl-L-alanine amidase [Bacillus wiedmannii]
MLIKSFLISKFKNIHFYDALSWQDKDGASFVNAGGRFTIDRMLNVNGSLQFKVHNSIGEIYYVTVNKACLFV